MRYVRGGQENHPRSANLDLGLENMSIIVLLVCTVEKITLKICSDYVQDCEGWLVLPKNNEVF